MKRTMTEAHDENSINTDVTFESGDENVSAPNGFLEMQMNSFLDVFFVGRCDQFDEYE